MLFRSELAVLRRENKAIKYLRPDAKSQVTLEYDDNNIPVRIDAIVVSTQHDDFASDAVMAKKIYMDMVNILIPRVKAKYPKYKHLFNNKIKYHINPTGKFVIGGPHGDTGVTGRKIIVDTYGGKAHTVEEHFQEKILQKLIVQPLTQHATLQKI